jgi:hypothetical protein
MAPKDRAPSPTGSVATQATTAVKEEKEEKEVYLKV